MIKCLILSVFTLVSFKSAIADESTYINTEYNYMVTFPNNIISGYCVDEDNTGGGYRLYNKEKQDGKCGLLIDIDRSEKSNYSPEEIIANFINYHNENSKKYDWLELIDVKPIKIGDELGIKYIEKVQIIKRVESVIEDGTYPGKSISLDIDHNGFSYFLTCVSDLKDFDKNKDQYEYVINSFTFLDTKSIDTSKQSFQSIAICGG